jgi:two-component system sensor histidine kinase KdpD
MTSFRRGLAGVLVAVGGIAVLAAAMVPGRTRLPEAIPALVLVVPVVAGVAVGGLLAGVVAVATGFLAFDLLFVPPYDTLSVGSAEGWMALGAYVAVMLVVSFLVTSVHRAQSIARRQEEETRRLYLLSDLLIGDRPVDELLQHIVNTIHQAFHARWVAALLPDGEELSVTATAGDSLTEAERRQLVPERGRPASLRPATAGGTVRLALATGERPVGVVALAGAPLDAHDWDLLRAYGNQAALALERSQLRDQAVRAELLEQVDRWRDALMSAVSHDLRTPLASVKAAVSTLRQSGPGLDAAARDELMSLIESQSDSLDRMVADLLDMTRIRAGALRLRRESSAVVDMLDSALRVLTGAVPTDWVVADLAVNLPPVDVDRMLVERVLANLVENAIRHSPEGGPVEVAASRSNGLVELSVTDHGPGVPVGERERVFEMFNGTAGGGRAGLGLAIARSFVEAHGQTIRVEDAPGGGARFVMTLPVTTSAGPGADR